MSFHFISSNHIPILMHAMSEQLKANPLAQPLTPELILVPSQGMERWLNLKLADAMGISCNMDYPMPASWIWQHIASNQGRRDALSRESSAWMIFHALPELLPRDAFAPLRCYLEDDADELKRWQLADRIADTFDRYQYYRPDLIRRWCQGEESNWQAQLWRILLEQVGNDAHRVAMMDAWQIALRDKKPDVLNALPQRISMFCISNLPPLLLQLFQQLAEHIDIYFYHNTPTSAYWADLHSKKSEAKKRLEEPNEDVYYPLGHELLTSWGRQGQIFQDLLLKHESLHTIEYEAYCDSFAEHQLAGIQQDICNTIRTETPETTADGSMSVHICHSPLRECQVLHDSLLHYCAQDKTLKLEDILVMVPDINTYAPYLHSVFAEQADRPHLAYHISDVAIAEEHPVIHTFLQLLKLPDARFTRSDIESMLHIKEVCQHFSIDPVADAETIHRLLDTLNVRWGLDAEHRDALGLPAHDEHTWKQAKQRFLTGYAMSGDADVWQDIAPIDITGNEASLMAQYWSILNLMAAWRSKLAASRTAEQWELDLSQMMQDFFGDIAEHDALIAIQESLAQLAEHAGADAIPRSLLCYLLQQKLNSSEVSNRYFAGGIQMCGFRPMRSVPFRVVCLLGMQDSDIPRREYPLSFDKMGDKWQAGDPSKAEQDRYLMLETLLAAQDTLYISYTGRSIRDNSDIQPSILVHELLDEVAGKYGEEVRNSMQHTHPLQAFSSDNFTEQQPSYDAYWHQVAQCTQQRTAPRTNAWPQHALNTIDTPQEIGLSQLIRFAKHPVKFFVQHSLEVYFHEDDALCDDEPFELNGLEAWSMKYRYIQADLEQEDAPDARMHAEGLLPHGVAGAATLEVQQEAVQPLIEQLHKHISTQGFTATPQIVAVSIPHQNTTIKLVGRVERYQSGLGLLHVTPSSLKGKYLLACWLEHLALCAAGIMQPHEQSILLCSDKKEGFNEQCFAYLEPQHAITMLASYIASYIEGLQRPLPIFENASYHYMYRLNHPKPRDIPSQQEQYAMSDAHTAWEGNSFTNQPGDKDDAYVAFIMRHVDAAPIEEDDFITWAETFYAPIHQHGASA